MTDKYTIEDVDNSILSHLSFIDRMNVMDFMNKAYEEGMKDGGCNNINDCANQININLESLKKENEGLKNKLDNYQAGINICSAIKCENNKLKIENKELEYKYLTLKLNKSIIDSAVEEIKDCLNRVSCATEDSNQHQSPS